MQINYFFKILMTIIKNISILCTALYEFTWLVDIGECFHTLYLVLILLSKAILELLRLGVLCHFTYRRKI